MSPPGYSSNSGPLFEVEEESLRDLDSLLRMVEVVEVVAGAAEAHSLYYMIADAHESLHRHGYYFRLCALVLAEGGELGVE